MRLFRRVAPRDIFDDLVHYVDAPDTPLALVKVRADLGPMELRYVALRLLDWLDKQGNPTAALLPLSERRLQIDPRFQWCANLVHLLMEFEALGQRFQVKDGELAWRDEVPFEEQLAIVKRVHRKWRGTRA